LKPNKAQLDQLKIDAQKPFEQILSELTFQRATGPSFFNLGENFPQNLLIWYGRGKFSFIFKISSKIQARHGHQLVLIIQQL